jgi:hypothetical protein
MSNTTQQQVLVGHVHRYDPAKKFGFAYFANLGDVFFHIGNQRVVAGSFEQPVITNRPCREVPHWYRGMSETPRIVARVAEGPKGLKATAWGIPPQRDWFYDLTTRRVLDRYQAGNYVSLDYSGVPYPRRPNRGLSGRLTGSVELPVRVEGKRQLTLAFEFELTRRSRRYNHSEPASGIERVSLWLEDDNVRPEPEDLPANRYTLAVGIAGADHYEWATISFSDK